MQRTNAVALSALAALFASTGATWAHACASPEPATAEPVLRPGESAAYGPRVALGHAAPENESAVAKPAKAESKGKGKDDTKAFVPADSSPPPGLVPLKGGNVLAGTKVKDIEKLMTTPTNQGSIRVVDGETPQHRAKVGNFAMGKYEVTNQQYEHFVRATGHQPPEHWGAEVIKAAQAEFLKGEGLKAKEAIDAGSRYERQKWDEPRMRAWWTENWPTAAWSIPKGNETMPVSFVTYDDAVAYCRWAGLRLPTEYEWIYAARGSDNKWFTWGDEFEAKGNAHTSEIGTEKPQRVGSFPGGATKDGIMDLIGSVWEWTDSPYTAYPKFKPNKYKFKKSGRKVEEVKPEPKWNGSFRIIKGGAKELGLLAARIATRQGAKRDQTTSALGFRVASSLTPGMDKAQAIWAATIQNSQARDGGIFDYEGVVALDRWQTDSAASGPDDYAVITGYDHILFTPRTEFEVKPGAALNRASRIKPVVLGFLSTTIPIATPALEPGQYLVTYREKGRLMSEEEPKKEEAAADEKKGEDKGDEGEEKKDEGPADDTPLDLLTPEQRLLRMIDLKDTVVIFSDPITGEYVTSMPTSKLPVDVKASKAKPGSITLERKNAFDENDQKIQQDWLTIGANIRLSGTRVIPFGLEVMLPQDVLGDGWRSSTVGKKK